MSTHPSLDDLAHSPAHAWVRQRAAERLRACLGGDIPAAPGDERRDDDESRALARHLAFQLGGRRALHLAISAEWRGHEPSTAKATLKHMGIDVLEHLGSYTLPVADYVWIAPRLPGFHLIERRFEDHRVLVNGDDLVQLAIEAQVRDVLRRNPRTQPDPDAALGGPFSDLIRDSGAAEALRLPPPLPVLPLAPASAPPCIQELEGLLAHDGDLGHTGRFALVAYWGATGLDAATITSRFAKRRDFDEATTRYHVEHILGKHRERAYQPPGCSKMQSDGLCPLARRDDVCRRVKHPLTYARIKGAP